MKVLMLDGAGFSPPYDFSLVRGLEMAGASVRLVMPETVRGDWRDPDRIPERNTARSPRIIRRLTKAMGYAALLGRVRQTVASWEPDVVHVQWLPLPLADGLLLKSLKGRVPLVYTMHNTSLFHGGSGGVQGWGLRSALECFDRIVVHSEFSRRSAVALELVNEDVLRVIPHGAFDYYSEFVGHADVRGPDSRVHLVFAGSIKSYKGLDVLVESLPTLAAATPNGAWHLTIAGQPGIPIAPLERAIRDYGLGENVTWSLRHQSERELGRLLGAADVVVLPYREIDQSGVLLAAVGVKRAVVATRVGAFPELLRHETHGLLVSPEDPLELGRALARLVVDSPLRTYCQRQMQHLASGELHWATIGHKTLNLYKELTRT